MRIIKINAIWCSGCLAMKKTWQTIKEKYPDIEIIEYDYDIDEKQIEKYNIGNILPVAIFQKKEKEKRLIGEKTKEEIEKVIQEINA